MSSTWSTASARIGNVPAESDEARRFLQQRLALFAGATTAISAMLLLVAYGAPLLVPGSAPSRYGELGRGAHLAGTLLLLAVWLVARARRVLSARALAALDVMAVCGAHLHQAPRPPSSLRPDVPPDLEAVLLACLAKDREERPASADELAARLSACEHASAWTRERAAAWWSHARPARSAELEHAETLTAVQIDLAERAAERP